MKLLPILTEEMLKLAFDIRFKVFVEEQGVPREEEMDEYDVSPAACHHYLLMKDNLPIATGRWKPFEPGVVKMQRIAVLKPYRGLGAGSILLEGMEEDRLPIRVSGIVIGCPMYGGKFLLEAWLPYGIQRTFHGRGYPPCAHA